MVNSISLNDATQHSGEPTWTWLKTDAHWFSRGPGSNQGQPRLQGLWSGGLTTMQDVCAFLKPESPVRGHVSRVWMLDYVSESTEVVSRGAAPWGVDPRAGTSPPGVPTFSPTIHLSIRATVRPLNRWQLWTAWFQIVCVCLFLKEEEELSFLGTQSLGATWVAMERTCPRQQAGLDSVFGSVIRGWVTSSQFQNLLDFAFFIFQTGMIAFAPWSSLLRIKDKI